MLPTEVNGGIGRWCALADILGGPIVAQNGGWKRARKATLFGGSKGARLRCRESGFLDARLGAPGNRKVTDPGQFRATPAARRLHRQSRMDPPGPDSEGRNGRSSMRDEWSRMETDTTPEGYRFWALFRLGPRGSFDVSVLFTMTYDSLRPHFSKPKKPKRFPHSVFPGVFGVLKNEQITNSRRKSLQPL